VANVYMTNHQPLILVNSLPLFGSQFSHLYKEMKTISPSQGDFGII
jgi:hypothetical protein